MFKVAFSGSHGVGKTTAVAAFADMARRAGLRAAVGEEVARRCPLPVNEASSAQAQIWLLTEQIAQEAYLEASGCQVAVLDRCVFDHVAYARRLHGRGRVGSGELSFIEHAAREWARVKPYAAVVFLEAEGPPEPDGFRSTSRSFQLEVQEELAKLYNELDVREGCVRLLLKSLPRQFMMDAVLGYVVALTRESSRFC